MAVHSIGFTARTGAGGSLGFLDGDRLFRRGHTPNAAELISRLLSRDKAADVS
jgi:hypothetical protein